MSDYCYQCLKCGEFKEDCTCPIFDDPMAQYKEDGIEGLLLEKDLEEQTE